MKKVLFPILALALVLAMALAAIPAQAADEAAIQTSIDDGVTWLVAQQNPDGSWADWDQVGVTGFAVVKLEDLAFERGMSPFDPDYEYSANVMAGLDYIFSQATSDGCGLHIETWHETYSTGIAMMAIAAGSDMNRVVSVGNPWVDGMTYGEVLQAFVDYFACAQNPDGGWRYWYLNDPSDQSNTGYAVLGLKYAETAGINIPQSLKDNLSIYIDYIQNDVDGDPEDGGCGYTSPGEWVNLLKTGHLLFEMAFVGDNLATQRVQDAIDYIERHWEDANQDPGWKGSGQPHFQAAYLLMKGFEAFNIQTLSVSGSDIDWFNEMADAIIGSQIYGGPMGDGYWPWDYWGGAVLATEWALLTLERVAPPSETTVPVDIKPTSCRNPLNVGDEGVLPVAILGTEDFDVTQIDPATVLLGNVPALRWALEDVAEPFEPYIGKEDAFDCTTAGPDGYLDFNLKFDMQAVVADLGDVEDGDVLVLQLTGNLMEEYGGTAIMGEDVVVILKKGK